MQSSVMELAGILLAVWILVLSPPSTSAESGQLVLRHGYPENTNLSYISLTCLREDPKSHSVKFIKGAHFQSNGTDIEEEFNVIDIGEYSVTFILTPEKEGFFTCSLNGLVSNNSIGLADKSAQPSSDYSGLSRSHQVELPDADSVVSTELQCDIQPGALRHRYSVQWRQLLHDNYVLIAEERSFNLTLNVNYSLNGLQYQCKVTIDHDGSITQDYYGVMTALIVIITVPPTPSDTTALIIIVIGSAINVILSFCILFLILWIALLLRQMLYKRRQHRRYTFYNTRNISNEYSFSQQTTDLTSSISDYNILGDGSRGSFLLLDQYASSNTPVLHQTHSAGQEHGESDTYHDPIVEPQPEDQDNVEFLQTSARASQLSTTTEESFTPQWARSALAQQHMPHFDRYHRNTDRRQNKNVFEATTRPKNPFLPRYSADPCNTAQHIPKWMEPVGTLTDCTSDGKSYYDEQNDLRLEIPEGAIPEGVTVTIDIAVALYGPFQYPEGLRSVSPVFWVCVRGYKNFRFLKPVRITIEHCLSLDKDTDTHSLGLTFLKGDHSESTNQKYILQRLQGDEKYDFANDNHAVLHTNHFCYQCIASNISKEFLGSANFGILVLTPKEFVYSKPVLVYFFVIFLLEACLRTIEKQIEKQEGEQEGEGGTCMKKFYTTTLPFRFPKGEDNPVINLQWERTLPGGWSIELSNMKAIAYKDVDFYGMDPEHLKAWEMYGLYPPRFVVSIDGSHTTMKAVANFTFCGALTNTDNDDLKYTMQLLPQFPQPNIQGTGLTSSQFMTPPTPPPDSPIRLKLGIMDLLDVLLAVVSLAGRWKRLGLALGLYQPELNKIKGENSDAEDCLQEVLTNWLNQMYDVRRFGEPSWPVLVKAVACPAISIAQKYNILFFAA